jgi:serine/threonine protein kinase
MAVEKVPDTHQEPSSIMQGSNASFGAMLMEEETIDEYEDDDDPGYEAFECLEEDLPAVSQQLAEKYNFPQRAVLQWRPTEGKFLAREEPEVRAEETVPFRSSLLQGVRFPDSQDTFYPKEHESTIYDCFQLKVIYDREKTGFEETKDFQIVINSVIAGRYRVIEYLGSAAFSKAIQCLDEVTNEYVCMKIIENNKDYFDQSMDEIKLLKYINVNADVDEKNVLRLLDYFYHKEHLFIVTELLRDNLYEFSKYNRENEDEPYFTIGRLQRIAYQSLIALQYIHGLKLIHCDLKPENVLIKSYSRCQIKVIDFGSSCFIHDHLSSYVQSRSYRAPEVILGCKYDYKIDIWSMGCILAELWTGNVLFQNETVQGLLARVMGIVGGLPEEVFTSGKLVYNFFTQERLLFQEVSTDTKAKQNEHLTDDMVELISKHRKSKKKLQILVPKLSSLKARLRTSDLMFLDFVRCLLDTDRERRPSATEALRHPWIAECRYADGLQ